MAEPECSRDEIGEIIKMIREDDTFMITYANDRKKLEFRAAALRKISWLCGNYPIEGKAIEQTAMILIDYVLSRHEIPRMTYYGDNDYLFVLACFSIAARHKKDDFRRTDLNSVFPDNYAIIRTEKAIVRRVGGTEKTMLERSNSKIIGWTRFVWGSGGDAAKTGFAGASDEDSVGDALKIGFAGGSGEDEDAAKIGSGRMDWVE